MKSQRTRQIEKLLHDALALQPAERAACLARACEGDDSLRHEVERLLVEVEQSTAFQDEILSLAAPAALPGASKDHEKAMIGRMLGRYRLDALLGAGGMGEVYRAWDTRLARQVAIKILSEPLAQHSEALTRFEREAKAIAALSHPNILAIHDFGVEQNVTYAVMELLEGETLQAYLRRSTLTWRKAVEIGIPVAEGLAAAHDKGIIHRDLKPGNIFLTTEGHVKILDFGLARIKPVSSVKAHTLSTADSTNAGTLIGTIAYMSPEQLRGEGANAPSDIFAFGCVLYEMVTGQRPFARETAAETMAGILRDDPFALGETATGVPEKLEWVLKRCLEKAPHERFQFARDVALDLRTMLSSAKGSTALSASPKRGMILVVDDDVSSRDMLSRRLQRNGYDTAMAENGAEALELIGEQPFDVVVLDIMMPEIDGLTVLERIRAKHPMTDLPIILATAKGESEDVIRGLQLGANDYVTKPLNFPIVLARVQTQLALKRATAELRAAHSKMKHDLRAAARIQHALMPKAQPDIGGVRCAWILEPCQDLAGDILDVFRLDENHIGFYLLDVSAHGIEAALLSMTLSRVMSHLAADSPLLYRKSSGEISIAAPAEVARSLNERFPMTEQMGQYFTLLYGILDIQERNLCYISAGHPGPLLVPARRDPELLPGAGIPVGWFPTTTYREQKILLEVEDRLYLYSDAVTNAANPSGEMFGDRFIRSLHNMRDASIDESVSTLLRDVKQWCGDPGLQDDISILAFEIP